MTDEESRDMEAAGIYSNCMAWVLIDEYLKKTEWAEIQNKMPQAADQVFEAIDVVEKSHILYREGKIKIEDYKKTVKHLFNLLIEIISAYRGKPCFYLLRNVKK